MGSEGDKGEARGRDTRARESGFVTTRGRMGHGGGLRFDTCREERARAGSGSSCGCMLKRRADVVQSLDVGASKEQAKIWEGKMEDCGWEKECGRGRMA